jgi:3-oxoacyl-[acyl-carrier-protein] synthase-3
MFVPVSILGTGSVLPARCVRAEDLDAQLGVAPGTTLARNGVATRYFAAPEESSSGLGAAALRRALAAAGREPADLDAILFASVLAEQPMPTTSILIHRAIGGRAEGVTCFDLNASCNGFLKLLEIAASGIQAGLWRHAGIVAAELGSRGLHWDDLDTCTLFGDGAAAAVVGPGGPAGILASRSVTLSEGMDHCRIPAGGTRYNVRTPPPVETDYFFAMNGRGLLRLIQEHFPPFLDELLGTHPVSLVVPHQASAIGLAFLAKQLRPRGIPHVEILAEVGNQVTASLPTALHRALEEGRCRAGETTLLVGTAAGVSLSGLVLRH